MRGTVNGIVDAKKWVIATCAPSRASRDRELVLRRRHGTFVPALDSAVAALAKAGVPVMSRQATST